MAIGVSKWSGKVGITSLTSGSPTPIPPPTSDYLHLPLHASGSTTALTVNLGNIGPSECKVGGTLTSTWSVSGEVTLGTDNYINYGSTVGQIQPHVDFSTLGDGGLLLLWRLKVPDILTNKPFFSASPLGTSTGGWEILVNSAESLRFGHRPVGVGSTSFQAMESLTDRVHFARVRSLILMQSDLTVRASIWLAGLAVFTISPAPSTVCWIQPWRDTGKIGDYQNTKSCSHGHSSESHLG